MQNIQLQNLPKEQVVKIFGDSWEDIHAGSYDPNTFVNYCVSAEELINRGWFVVSNPLMIGKFNK